MKRLWTNDDLVVQWTLQPNELALLEYKEGANRLGFALLLKYFQGVSASFACLHLRCFRPGFLSSA